MARRDGTAVVAITLVAAWLVLLVALMVTVLPEFSWFTPERFERAVVGFAAVMLVFVAGVRWGLRLQGGGGSRHTLLAAALTLPLALLAMLVPYIMALAVLVVGYGAMGAWDVWSADRSEIPERWGTLRARMTLAFAITLIAIMFATRIAG